MIPGHLLKYVKYIHNNDLCSTRDFDDDFAPIGSTIRSDLVKQGICLDDEHNEVIIVTQAVREELTNERR